MTHLIGLRGSQGGVRAPLGIAIALSLLVAIGVEGSHTHSGAELSAVCSVCKIGDQSIPTSAADTPVIIGSGVLHAPALSGHRLIAGIVHLSPHRSRAPPLPTSL
jgi:hypothetical protein